MFAPRSTHLPRTYSVYNNNPTTSKKNTNKENANALPTKTPSRAGKSVASSAGTGLRLGLGIKTEGRDRNVLSQQQHAVGGGGKGKGKEGEDIEPKRLFAQGSSKSSTSIPPSKSLSSMPHIITKTPAPSRKVQQALRTPAPIRNSEGPGPTPLASATRTRRRSRQSLSNISLTPIKSQIEEQLQQQQQDFKTPAPKQWEEELSLGSIEEVVNDLATLQDVREEDEDDDEIEYMPPKVQELPFTLAFDHPDLTAIFSKLTSLPPLWTHCDRVIIQEVPEFEIGETEISLLNLKDDEELEEDWLRPKKSIAVQPAETVKPTAKLPAGRVPPKSTSMAGSAPQIGNTTRPNPSRGMVRPTTTNPGVRTKPPAPVPRPPPIRQGHSGTATRVKAPAQIPVRNKKITVLSDAERILLDSCVAEFDDDVELKLDI
ncbi:uncharacterized protein IL334_002286 [Kwoniella shivajii]|uniref:Uncharacterized protein n=1 Tax=Kwoniella shivajii TaxID=564305 RepID=A0ABZ1CUE6_9TREE|nr:hypothetical protein IL334_002286 [Kwoniella shivajii]